MTRTNDSVRFVAAKYGDGVGASQPAGGLLHGFEQIAGVQVIDQMGNDFGVGLTFEYIADRLQLFAQFVVVLDNAVMHQGDAGRGFALARKVGVSVMRSGSAMRGPACMGNAGKACNAFFTHLFGQFGNALGAARPAQFAIGMHGHTAGIIAAVFQALQAFERSEEHTSELQSLMRISYAVFCLKKKTPPTPTNNKIKLT